VVGAGREEALGIAERVRLGFAAAAGVIEGRRVDATVSVGLASRPGLPAGFDQMFDEADRALYLAKATGRNRVRQAREPEAPPAALSAA
jgi:diguanylate cyclase (GGDEF)-like protein